jgi:hypothetical protein
LGLFTLLIMFGFLLAAIFLLKWIYELKKNSELQIEQNKRMIELIENMKT